MVGLITVLSTNTMNCIYLALNTYRFKDEIQTMAKTNFRFARMTGPHADACCVCLWIKFETQVPLSNDLICVCVCAVQLLSCFLNWLIGARVHINFFSDFVRSIKCVRARHMVTSYTHSLTYTKKGKHTLSICICTLLECVSSFNCAQNFLPKRVSFFRWSHWFNLQVIIAAAAHNAQKPNLIFILKLNSIETVSQFFVSLFLSLNVFHLFLVLYLSCVGQRHSNFSYTKIKVCHCVIPCMKNYGCNQIQIKTRQNNQTKTKI